jgi:hypothetical protein
MRGVSGDDPERRSGEWRPADAARTAPQGGPDPDRQALMLGAGSRCGSGSTAGSRLRGSASENRRGGAPREVPVAPGQGGRASQARPKEIVRLSALHPPLIGGDGADTDTKGTTNPHPSLRRGNEKGTLFDIVRKGHAALNWPPFRPDTRHNLEGLRLSSSTGLCLTTTNVSN